MHTTRLVTTLFLALAAIGDACAEPANTPSAGDSIAPPSGSSLADVLSAEYVEDAKGVGSGQKFLRAAGSNFSPRSSTTTYSYFGGGCLQRNSVDGDSWFTLDLQIPDGSVIDFSCVCTTTTTTPPTTSFLAGWRRRTGGAGGTTLIAEADSSGSPGYGSAGSSFFSHTVDNINESLVVIASVQGGVGSDLALCGVRIRYQAP
ncbi:MAG: hypothetical protein R3F12_06520 [Lysobacteraceae bacterium]